MSRHTIGEAFLTAGSVGLILVGVVAVDWRSGGQVTSFVQSRALGSVGSDVAWLQGAGSALMDAIRYQSLEHAPLTVFFAVAIVLVLFMVRT